MAIKVYSYYVSKENMNIMRREWKLEEPNGNFRAEKYI